MSKPRLSATGGPGEDSKGERDESSAARKLYSGLFGFVTIAALNLAVSETALAATGAPAGQPHQTPTTTPVSSAPRFEVKVRRPQGPLLIATSTTNFQGQPVMVSCSYCHTTTKPNPETRRTEDLDQFHQGLKYQHGNMTCLSCHNANDYESLKLADGRRVDFSDSIELCSQCHGPQRRDYDRGLHGGMNGYWDLTKGGRTRNTCVNCHDPHSPAFPAVMPVLSPRDRISVPDKHTDHTKASHP